MTQTVLIVGGTQMVGRDFVESLLKVSDYNISIANRGITNPQLFPDLYHIFIDRNSLEGCASLKNLEFDVVIDFSCYNVAHLKNVLYYISYKHYVLISTQSVLDTNALANPNNWLFRYANDKKQIEQYIIQKSLENFSIVRPCALYGKNDYTNRFYEKNGQYYWRYNDQPVIKNKGYINVRDFSYSLLQFLNSKNLPKTKIVHIDGDGITYVSNSSL